MPPTTPHERETQFPARVVLLYSNHYFIMRFISFFALFLVVCCLGCGGGKGFSVSGKVTFSDGTPVPSGQVTFSSSNVTAGGGILPDGTYTVSTSVPAGTYKVTVMALENTMSDPNVSVEDAKPAKSLVDPKYNNPETSGLVCEVKGKTSFPITVEAPK